MLAKLPKHNRMKPRAKAEPTIEEARHMDRVASMMCEGCGAWEVNLHHVMKMPVPKLRRRDHRYVVALCRECHQGTNGVHGLGSEAAFKLKTGVDLPARALALWEANNAEF